MKRGFQGAPRPLLPSMLLVATNLIAGQEHAAQAQTQPIPPPPPIPSTTPTPIPTSTSPPQTIPSPTPTPIPTSTSPPQTIPSPTPPPIPTPTSPPPPPPETEPSTDEHIYEEQSPVHHHFSPSQAQAPIQLTKEGGTKKEKIYRQTVVPSLDIQEDNTDSTTLLKIKDKRRESTRLMNKHQRRHRNRSYKKICYPCRSIRLDTIQREEGAEQIHLDALLATKISEEELTEQQKKIKAQVQFEAQHYTNEDWDLIRAKLEANAELSKSMLGSELQGKDFAKEMVDLVNQRKKFFVEERAKAKRTRP
ncbi:hypothetical protein Tco_1352962 [Tanacetum coccineum]